MIRFRDTIREGLAIAGEPQQKARRLFFEKDRMDKVLDKDEQRFVQAVTEAMSPFLKNAKAGRQDIRSIPEPISTIARYYQRDLEVDDIAAELGIDDPAGLSSLVKIAPRLREYGLGPIIQGAAIKRSHWQSLDKSISPFQQTSSEMQLGTPYRSL